MRVNSSGLAVLVGALVALTVGCGGSSGSPAASQPTAAPTATPAPTVVTASVSVGGTMKTILTDSKGMTLYYYTPDKGGKVTCTAGCLAAWPALLLASDVTKPVGGPGVTGTLTTIANPDGKGTQVMYDNWPLYYFVKDKNPGDVTGENVGGKWFVVEPALAPGA